MTRFLLSLTLLFSVTLNASNLQCKEDGNQMQMNQCAYEDFQEADRELNKVYKALRHKNKDDKAYLKNLKISQNIWIQFRDAELNLIFTCETDNRRVCFGSMYPLLYHSEKEDITRQRIKNLNDYLREEES